MLVDVGGAVGNPVFFPAEGSDHPFVHQPSITPAIESVGGACDVEADYARGGSNAVIGGGLDAVGDDAFTQADSGAHATRTPNELGVVQAQKAMSKWALASAWSWKGQRKPPRRRRRWPGRQHGHSLPRGSWTV
jgi:hypothetical protein